MKLIKFELILINSTITSLARLNYIYFILAQLLWSPCNVSHFFTGCKKFVGCCPLQSGMWPQLKRPTLTLGRSCPMQVWKLTQGFSCFQLIATPKSRSSYCIFQNIRASISDLYLTLYTTYYTLHRETRTPPIYAHFVTGKNEFRKMCANFLKALASM